MILLLLFLISSTIRPSNAQNPNSKYCVVNDEVRAGCPKLGHTKFFRVVRFRVPGLEVNLPSSGFLKAGTHQLVVRNQRLHFVQCTFRPKFYGRIKNCSRKSFYFYPMMTKLSRLRIWIILVMISQRWTKIYYISTRNIFHATINQWRASSEFCTQTYIGRSVIGGSGTCTGRPRGYTPARYTGIQEELKLSSNLFFEISCRLTK